MLRLAAPMLSFLLVAPALLTTAAWAQTPAEQASRELNKDQIRDRAEDARESARPVPPPPQVPPQMQALETDRRSLQPDVGRPEQRGVPTTGGIRPPSGAQNPQR